MSDLVFRFAGNAPKLQFVEVENSDGESLDIGEWTQDGDFQLLEVNAVPIEDLQELVEEWREETRKALDDDLHGYAGGNTDCADELEEVLEQYE